jgi:2-oxoglutarate ferredoxin oxidoreductase subunit alpha
MTPSLPYFSFKIGGLAGQGIKSTGLMFSKLATRSGHFVYNHTEYPSLVRGGHNVMQVTISAAKIFAPVRHTNFLVALNSETISLHLPELTADGTILTDTSIKPDNLNLPENVSFLPIPLGQLARDAGGMELLGNIVALGAVAGLLSGNIKHLHDLIDQEFAGKSEVILRANHQAADLGFRYAADHFPDKIRPILTPRDITTVPLVVNANDTMALGAIAAGMQFAAIYPMTPISNLLAILAPLQEQYGFIYKQPEDEIAAVNMAIGASFAGARAMVATSGGGFCLMTEGYGLAGMTETPLVIIEGMRGAPATGLPTWSEQGDLRFVLHAHQGDFPRIILAAGDPEEAFHLTLKAFNLADKYQTPVVVLVDKNICEDDQSYLPFDYSGYHVDRGKLITDRVENYARYTPADDGISPRAIPGRGNHLLANSDEHNSEGYDVEEGANRIEQMKKRMQKLTTYEVGDLLQPMVYGPEKVETTIVSWGSNKGAIREALRFLPEVNFLHLTRIHPFPTAEVTRVLGKAKHIVDIECNFTAQMAGLIRERTGIAISDYLLKYDGRPIYPEEIIEKLNQYA